MHESMVETNACMMDEQPGGKALNSEYCAWSKAAAN
jgi:hypothetical protein